VGNRKERDQIDQHDQRETKGTRGSKGTSLGKSNPIAFRMPSAAVRPWQQALRPDAIFFRLSEALDSCAAAVSPQEDQQQRRVWAVDLACGRSTGPAPKFFVVATPAVFVDAYLAFSDRHAYEVVDSTRGCFLYFDLEQNFWSAAELAQAQEAGRRVADIQRNSCSLDSEFSPSISGPTA